MDRDPIVRCVCERARADGHDPRAHVAGGGGGARGRRGAGAGRGGVRGALLGARHRHAGARSARYLLAICRQSHPSRRSRGRRLPGVPGVAQLVCTALTRISEDDELSAAVRTANGIALLGRLLLVTPPPSTGALARSLSRCRGPRVVLLHLASRHTVRSARCLCRRARGGQGGQGAIGAARLRAAGAALPLLRRAQPQGLAEPPHRARCSLSPRAFLHRVASHAA